MSFRVQRNIFIWLWLRGDPGLLMKTYVILIMDRGPAAALRETVTDSDSDSAGPGASSSRRPESETSCHREPSFESSDRHRALAAGQSDGHGHWHGGESLARRR